MNQEPLSPPPPFKPGSPSNGSGLNVLLVILAFLFSLFGLLLSALPLIGTLGCVLAMIGGGLALPVIFRSGHEKPATHAKWKKWLALVCVVLCVFSVALTILWTKQLGRLPKPGSCPHVYSYNGGQYSLEADAFSGSLFEGAENTDFVLMERLAASDGKYRIRVINERDELDYIDMISLVTADHDANVEVAPNQEGGIVAFTRTDSPLHCENSRHGNVLRQVAYADDLRYIGDPGHFSSHSASEPLDVLTVRFRRPSENRAQLIFRGNNSPFAATAVAHYLAQMGPGLGPVLRHVQGTKPGAYRRHIGDEIRRLGLLVRVEVWDGVRWQFQTEIQPIGPAIQRTIAVPINVPYQNDPFLEVRLSMTPLFWEIDQVQLANANPAPYRVQLGRLTIAQDQRKRDVIALLGNVDRQRIVLNKGDSFDAYFDVPAAQNTKRTLLVKIRGYYEMEIGGKDWLNPLALMRHRSGTSSLPRFALELAHRQPQFFADQSR